MPRVASFSFKTLEFWTQLSPSSRVWHCWDFPGCPRWCYFAGGTSSPLLRHSLARAHELLVSPRWKIVPNNLPKRAPMHSLNDLAGQRVKKGRPSGAKISQSSRQEQCGGERERAQNLLLDQLSQFFFKLPQRWALLFLSNEGSKKVRLKDPQICHHLCSVISPSLGGTWGRFVSVRDSPSRGKGPKAAKQLLWNVSPTSNTSIRIPITQTQGGFQRTVSPRSRPQ